MARGQPYRLEEGHLLRGDYQGLKAAVEAGLEIEATNLEFEIHNLQTIRALLPIDHRGRPELLTWKFDGSSFPEGADFSLCQITRCSFAGCRFGPHSSFAGTRFGRGNFQRTHFGGDANFEKAVFAVKADFHRARFGDRARFSRARFESSQFYAAEFGSEASFSRSVFAGPARFHDARFGARASLSEAVFEGKVDFSGASFGEKAQLVQLEFSGSPSFIGARFGARARLTDWRVAGSLKMRSIHCLGEVSLHGAKVAGDASFEYAQFDGFVDLGHVLIGGDATFSFAYVSGADRFGPIQAGGSLRAHEALVTSPCLISVTARLVDFSGSRFHAPIRILIAGGDMVLDRVDTGPRLFVSGNAVAAGFTRPRLVSIQEADIGPMLISGLDVKPMRFYGADGIDNLHMESDAAFEHAPKGPRAHREAIAEEHELRRGKRFGSQWYPEACKSPVGPGVDRADTGARELARVYRSLRKSREDSRDAPGAADFYYGEMEMRRSNAYEQLGASRRLGSTLLHAGNVLLFELYRLFGGYGVRPGRPFAVLLAGLLVAGLAVDRHELIQMTVPGPGDTTTEVDPGFQDSLVFVLRSALLLPTAHGVVLSTRAEWIQIGARILGPLLLGLFAFGLRARVHR